MRLPWLCGTLQLFAADQLLDPAQIFVQAICGTTEKVAIQAARPVDGTQHVGWHSNTNVFAQSQAIEVFVLNVYKPFAA